MVSSDILARLRFLNDAAHLLAIPAPETSRRLMSKHESLSLDHNLESKVQQQMYCGACGTLVIVGKEGRLEMVSVGVGYGRSKREKKQKQIFSSQHKKVMEYTCNCCRAITRFPANLPSKLSSRRRITSQAPTNHSTTAVLEQPASGPATPSSKIKNRTKSKKKGGLAAILAKQKESQTSSAGFGLDLMDFMKAS